MTSMSIKVTRILLTRENYNIIFKKIKRDKYYFCRARKSDFCIFWSVL